MFLTSADHVVLQYCHLIACDCKDLRYVLRLHYADTICTCLFLFSSRICPLFVANNDSFEKNQDFFHFMSDYSMRVRFSLPFIIRR